MATFDPAASDPADQQLHALLDRYGCPLPFHAARAQLLGALVSPASDYSSRQALAALWGKKAPAFAATESDAEIDAVLQDLSERLTQSDSTGETFRLMPLQTEPTRDQLARLALVRREEIDAFVAGLFGNEEALELTKPAHAALDSMADIRSLLQHLRNFLDDPVKRSSPEGLAASLRSVQDMMPPLENAMNKVLQQCSAVRKQGVRKVKGSSPARVLH